MHHFLFKTLRREHNNHGRISGEAGHWPVGNLDEREVDVINGRKTHEVKER